MNIERGRSNPGFQDLPSVASSLGTQPPTQPTTANPPSPTISNTSTQQQTTAATPQQQQPIPERPTVTLPPRPPFQPPRFTPPGFMAWPRMPAPFNPWAGRIGPTQPPQRPTATPGPGSTQNAQNHTQNPPRQQQFFQEQEIPEFQAMQQHVQNPGEWFNEEYQHEADMPPLTPSTRLSSRNSMLLSQVASLQLTSQPSGTYSRI
jgi:hypothetical protein